MGVVPHTLVNNVNDLCAKSVRGSDAEITGNVGTRDKKAKERVVVIFRYIIIFVFYLKKNTSIGRLARGQ